MQLGGYDLKDPILVNGEGFSVKSFFVPVKAKKSRSGLAAHGHSFIVESTRKNSFPFCQPNHHRHQQRSRNSEDKLEFLNKMIRNLFLLYLSIIEVTDSMARKQPRILIRQNVKEDIDKLLIAERKISLACDDYINSKQEKKENISNSKDESLLTSHTEYLAALNKSELKMGVITPGWNKQKLQESSYCTDEQSSPLWNQKQSQHRNKSNIQNEYSTLPNATTKISSSILHKKTPFNNSIINIRNIRKLSISKTAEPLNNSTTVTVAAHDDDYKVMMNLVKAIGDSVTFSLKPRQDHQKNGGKPDSMKMMDYNEFAKRGIKEKSVKLVQLVNKYN